VTILVVGGAGFIGSHVNKMLLEAGFKTIVFDNLSRGNPRSVVSGELIIGDLANYKDIQLVFEKFPIKAVMHFAAFTDVGESVLEPALYYANNVFSTLNLLNCMREYEVKTFIFSSSAAIFGYPQEKKITEHHPCQPVNPYGETKLIVERMLTDFDRAYELKSFCLRYFNAAGGDPKGELKNYKQKENNLIPIVLKSLKGETGHVTIFGTDYPTPDGTCIRDYIHVQDLAEAHILALKKLLEGAPSSSYNLGNGYGYSVKEVIATAEKVTGIKAHVKVGPRRPGDPPILIASGDKAKKELGWTPKYPELETIIAHAWGALL
jgi:UDP-glucose 4-epimerase